MNECNGKAVSSSLDLKPQHTLPIDKVLPLLGTWKQINPLELYLPIGCRSHHHSR